MKKLLLIGEISLLTAALAFAVLWALRPASHFDAFLGIATVLLAVLETTRQFAFRDIKNPFQSRLRSAGDLRDLLNRGLAELEYVTRTDYNQIFLNNQSGHEGRLLAVADSLPNHKQRYRVAIYDGLLGSAYSNNRTIKADDVRQLKGYFPAVPETLSELVVPIRSDDTVLGVINSESEELNHFTEEMQGQLEQLGAALGRLLTKLGWDPQARADDVLWIKKSPSIRAIGSEP